MIEKNELKRLSKLMRAYLPVPHSWYMGLLGVNFGAAGEPAFAICFLALACTRSASPLRS
jgi:hypothetical protein